MRFELVSHADERGSVVYNKALTERRMATVLDYIQRKGLDMNRLSTRTASKLEPIIPRANNEPEHALNRRTTIRLYDPTANNKLRNRNYEVAENSPLNKSGLWFRIQVGAFKEPPQYPNHFFGDLLRALPDVRLSYYQDRDGLYKFTVGEFSSIDQARRLNQRILDTNRECYVVPFIDGQRITVHEATVLLKKLR